MNPNLKTFEELKNNEGKQNINGEPYQLLKWHVFSFLDKYLGLFQALALHNQSVQPATTILSIPEEYIEVDFAMIDGTGFLHLVSPLYVWHTLLSMPQGRRWTICETRKILDDLHTMQHKIQLALMDSPRFAQSPARSYALLTPLRMRMEAVLCPLVTAISLYSMGPTIRYPDAAFLPYYLYNSQEKVQLYLRLVVHKDKPKTFVIEMQYAQTRGLTLAKIEMTFREFWSDRGFMSLMFQMKWAMKRMEILGDNPLLYTSPDVIEKHIAAYFEDKEVKDNNKPTEEYSDANLVVDDLAVFDKPIVGIKPKSTPPLSQT
jgi:hypothetical protein